MSKGLEALKSIEKEMSELYGSDIAYYPDNLEKFQIIANELKALDIILEKRVQISWFTSLLKNFPNYTHDDYNFALPDNMQLMKEEYELLKEVLP